MNSPMTANIDQLVREIAERFDALADVLGAKVAAAARDQLGRPRMLPIKDAPVSYRRLLEAERAGELRIYRVGHASLVDEVELFDWIKRSGARVAMSPEPEPADEIGALVEMNDVRRARAGGRR